MTDPKRFREAYLETLYCAADVCFTLEERSAVNGPPSADALYGGRAFTLITAANPRSRTLEDAENAARNLEMETDLIARGWLYGPSHGRDAAHTWREDGFVVWDQDAASTLELGQCFEQNAIVYGSAGAVWLGWCDTGELEPFTARIVD